MKKKYSPLIRVISVENERTSLAEQRLRHALDKRGLHDIVVNAVYCHLEAGRCGVPSGGVALEVDGQIVWSGKELEPEVAEAFSAQLPAYVEKKSREYGLNQDQ